MHGKPDFIAHTPSEIDIALTGGPARRRRRWCEHPRAAARRDRAAVPQRRARRVGGPTRPRRSRPGGVRTPPDGVGRRRARLRFEPALHRRRTLVRIGDRRLEDGGLDLPGLGRGTSPWRSRAGRPASTARARRSRSAASPLLARMRRTRSDQSRYSEMRASSAPRRPGASAVPRAAHAIAPALRRAGRRLSTRRCARRREPRARRRRVGGCAEWGRPSRPGDAPGAYEIAPRRARPARQRWPPRRHPTGARTAVHPCRLVWRGSPRPPIRCARSATVRRISMTRRSSSAGSAARLRGTAACDAHARRDAAADGGLGGVGCQPAQRLADLCDGAPSSPR